MSRGAEFETDDAAGNEESENDEILDEMGGALEEHSADEENHRNGEGVAERGDDNRRNVVGIDANVDGDGDNELGGDEHERAGDDAVDERVEKEVVQDNHRAVEETRHESESGAEQQHLDHDVLVEKGEQSRHGEACVFRRLQFDRKPRRKRTKNIATHSNQRRHQHQQAGHTLPSCFVGRNQIAGHKRNQCRDQQWWKYLAKQLATVDKGRRSR